MNTWGKMLVGAVLVGGAAFAAETTVASFQQSVIGPLSPNSNYVLSPRGQHLATIARKGSRMVVVVDGAAGPPFDSIVDPTMANVDPRPYQSLDSNSVPHPGPVTFSRDGRRFGYIARQGQEWVVMVDNKEWLRLPLPTSGGPGGGVGGSEVNVDVRLEFSGEEGQHVLFARSAYGGNELWVDGQKWPGFYRSAGTGTNCSDPLINPEGSHIAYSASLDVRGSKQTIIFDGKDTGYSGEQLQFTPDGRHLLCLSPRPAGVAVLIDGKSFFTGKELLQVIMPPVGGRLIFILTHFGSDGVSRDGNFLMVDGKPVPATLSKGGSMPTVIFSPDGKRYAAICGSPPNRFVVLDGKKGQEYFNINDRGVAGLSQGISFSPDSTKLIYVASTTAPGPHDFVVINEEESDAMQNPWYKFSEDGKHVAYGGAKDQAQTKYLLMVDNKPIPLKPGWYVQNFAFSPNGSRFAFLGAQGGNKGIFVDGTNTELVGEFAFSPDSNHIAIAGFRPADNKSGLFVNGQLVYESYDKPLQHHTFSPDSRHLFWAAREPTIGERAGPGMWQDVIYVDGIATARCDSVASTQPRLGAALTRFGAVGWKTPPAWGTVAANELDFVGPEDESIKRFQVIAPPESSIETMITEAKAAPARAAAKAAELKKKNEEEAAAKKAKATADAAAAAAKTKADYDAALAQRKADYDAAIAKRKADYDAAVAARAEQLRQQQQKK